MMPHEGSIHGIRILYIIRREKERYLTQSYDENPCTYRKFNNQYTKQRRDQILRLHNECGST